MKRLALTVGAFLLATVLSPSRASASLVLDATAGICATGRCAEAVFTDLGGGLLQVDLINGSTVDVTDPQQVLTGVFFLGISALSPSSALLNGSTVFFGPNGGGNVGGEWAYAYYQTVNNVFLSGISSAGLGIFGSGNFGGSNLDGPDAVDGLQYGITALGDNTATGNAAVTGNNELIQNHVRFVLTGYTTGTAIGGVQFQYGTSLADFCFGCTTNTLSGSLEPTPEPATLALLGTGLAIVSTRIRRRQKK